MSFGETLFEKMARIYPEEYYPNVPEIDVEPHFLFCPPASQNLTLALLKVSFEQRYHNLELLKARLQDFCIKYVDRISQLFILKWAPKLKVSVEKWRD